MFHRYLERPTTFVKNGPHCGHNIIMNAEGLELRLSYCEMSKVATYGPWKEWPLLVGLKFYGGQNEWGKAVEQYWGSLRWPLREVAFLQPL